MDRITEAKSAISIGNSGRRVPSQDWHRVASHRDIQGMFDYITQSDAGYRLFIGKLYVPSHLQENNMCLR